ncbi:MAG TPA: potassium transporter TrkG [Xanthobacteraceae bacterium]|nr:potassium transporter TrkG [Xanthobacteraceae bacterium]
MVAVARHSVRAAGVMAAFLLACALVAAGGRDPAAVVFVLTALMTVFLAGGVHLATRSRAGRLDRVGSFVLLLLLWLGLPVLGAIPVAATTSLGPMGAWFETVCAITTTGSCALHSLDDVPRATLAWLLCLQWFGGLLTLVGVVAVLAPAGIGGLPDRAARAAEFGLSEATEIDDAIRHVLPVYGGATVLCMLALFAVGVGGLDAFGLASAAISTGGLLPDADGIAAYGDVAVKLVLIVFMLVGGTSLLWQRMILSRRFRLAFGQTENFAVLLVCGVVGLLVGAVSFRAGHGEIGLPLAVEDGLFTAVSLVTTTGVEPHAGAFASLPLGFVLVLLCIGGATFSTSGGLKMYRVGAALMQSLRDLNRLIYPHAVRPRRLRAGGVEPQAMTAIWLCLSASGLLIAVCAAMIAPAMPSFEATYVAVIAALTNAGAVFTANWAGSSAWPDWGDVPDYAKIALAALMILGRLEILVVLGLVHFGFWRR